MEGSADEVAVPCVGDRQVRFVSKFALAEGFAVEEEKIFYVGWLSGVGLGEGKDGDEWCEEDFVDGALRGKGMDEEGAGFADGDVIEEQAIGGETRGFSGEAAGEEFVII